MPFELYKDPEHTCVMFSDLSEEDGQAVQSNQFLIVNNKHSAVIDPGGSAAFNSLYLKMQPYACPHKLDYILASHADPDIIGALDRWLTTSSAQLLISTLWTRFAPYMAKSGKTINRIIGITDPGGILTLGQTSLIILPAHFMHSEGNFQFYDPRSKILFSGDLGGSLISGKRAREGVHEFAHIVPFMEAFHRRYMISNKILRYWVNMVRSLDIAMVVPQHGAPLMGKQVINDFFNWLEQLECGIDIASQSIYKVPTHNLNFS